MAKHNGKTCRATATAVVMTTAMQEGDWLRVRVAREYRYERENVNGGQAGKAVHALSTKVLAIALDDLDTLDEAWAVLFDLAAQVCASQPAKQLWVAEVAPAAHISPYAAGLADALVRITAHELGFALLGGEDKRQLRLL